MTGKQINKSEGPSCACGKVDLYEEWLKQNENKSDETTVSTSEEQESDDSRVNSDGNKK